MTPDVRTDAPAQAGQRTAGSRSSRPVPDVAATRPRRSGRHRRGGRRQQLRRARRRRRLLRTGLVVGGLVGLAGLGLLAATRLPLGGEPAQVARDRAVAPGGDAQPSLLLVTFDEQDPKAGASVAFVLARDPAENSATLLFLPTTTVADIPGHGLDRLARAFAYGGGPLVAATVENLLGVDLDGVAEVSEQGWAALFGRVGGLTVEVPERLVEQAADGSRRVRFEPGRQPLDGQRLAELMTMTAEDDDHLDRIPRVQRVLTAFLAAVAQDPQLLDSVVADGAPMLDTDVPVEQVRSLLDAAARAQADHRLAILTLPVAPIGSGEEGAVRIDAERADRLVSERLAASVPAPTAAAGRRLQILNGNGEPGIGQQVAERLLPAGFRVAVTDNADRFDHAETRIVVYDDSARQLALARDVQRLLGVGRIELSRTPTSVVDITIVVGDDFPPAAPGAIPSP